VKRLGERPTPEQLNWLTRTNGIGRSVSFWADNTRSLERVAMAIMRGYRVHYINKRGDYDLITLEAAMSDKRVEVAWLAFKEVYPPPDPAPGLEREMRRMFYAGVHWALIEMTGPIANLPEDLAIERLDAMLRETDKFGRDIAEGRA
jgi:hypothetical protein